MFDNKKLAVLGLGYVGLPLAVEFSKKFDVIGFDISADRIEQLRQGCDHTLEVDATELKNALRLSFTSELSDIGGCTIFIVTVPTPIDAHKRPDLGPLLRASDAVGSVLKPGDIVIFESTVYPGATEEDCVPVLAAKSGLQFNRDFFVGYSPERINPGDRVHRISQIKKITSGSTPEVASVVDDIYRQIISAGTHKAESIKVAEAAKVIENTQRDLNIALINELAIIFNKMGIETSDVLAAAATKWNFISFRPGLVGGHCIGVDPYYLTHKAEEIGYRPEVILAGRRINDQMGAYIANQLIRAMLIRRLPVNGGRVLVMGLTFKENCPDLRNTRVRDVVCELQAVGCEVDIFDPWVKSAECSSELKLIPYPDADVYDAVIIAVAHDVFREMPVATIRKFSKQNGIVYDIKGVLPREHADLTL